MPVPIEIATGLMDAFANFGNRINPDIAKAVLFESSGMSDCVSGGGALGLDKEPIVVSNETDWDSLNKQLEQYLKARKAHPPYGEMNWMMKDYN